MVENNGRYSSTKFSSLKDSESKSTARKNYLICFIIATLFICVTVAFMSYKIFVAPHYVNDENLQSLNGTANTKVDLKYLGLKLYNPKRLLVGFRRTTSEDRRELTCGESQAQLKVIPGKFIREILEKTFESIQDYFNLDLLLHYENIINGNTTPTLKTIFKEYHSKLSLARTSGDFFSFLLVLKSNKFKFYATHLKETTLELKNFQGFFALTFELNHWYNYLSRLQVFLSGYEQQKLRKYLLNCTEENFEKFTEDTQKQLFHFAFPFGVTDKKLQEINEVISEWAKPVKTLVDDFSVVLQGKVILLSAANKQLLGLNIMSVESVFFFAGHTIYIDEDMELPGVNLAIIAPNWVFVKKVKINLNGAGGMNVTDDASFGQSGRPGNPGQSAGNFLGLGNPQEKFLVVSANGGTGGNGQNGAKGADGENNTFPGPPVDKPTCMTKGTTFINAFGQMITNYKIYNESGCGRAGTDGGVGGQGGRGGVITLINKTSVKVRTGSNGAAGSFGKGGAGGMGGRSGCFYEVLDIDDEILYRVTGVKCPAGNVLPSGEFGKDNYNSLGQTFPPRKENLKVHECLLRFILFAGEDFDSEAISLLKHAHISDIKDIVLEYERLEKLDRFEIYEVLLIKVNKYMFQPSAAPILSYLKSILLGHMAILKNINFYFIDLKNYLNIIKRDIKTTSEHTRGLQSVIYLKRKINVKKEQIKENLGQISHHLGVNTHENFPFNCILLMTINWLQVLLSQTSDERNPNDLVKTCRIYFNRNTENNKKMQPEQKLFGILENITSSEEVTEGLDKVKDSLNTLKNSDVLSEEEKDLLEGLTEELEHLIALYYFIDWEKLENLFLVSLQNLSMVTKPMDEEFLFLQGRLLDVMIAFQYSLAMDAIQQTMFPLSTNKSRLQFSEKKSIMEEALTGIILLEENADRTTESFCRNQVKAVFDEKSAVGGFYFWPNRNIKKKLRILFSGVEINLKSDLINCHIFDKNFVQFTSLKLEFECGRQGSNCQERLNGILDNFKIEMVHSGYSYYNWKGNTRIVISDAVSLEYSFRWRDNKEPEIYNALYKKCADGEIKLSPYTTWTVRLLPINDEADFYNLLPFSEVVNLRLTGSGTYTS